MSTITTRTTKGSSLTWDELDDNFTNLNTDKLEASDITNLLETADIGVSVQAYDPDLTTWAGVTPGAGVATALAMDVGSAGAPVVFDGDGGTPSAIILTNATGYPNEVPAGTIIDFGGAAAPTGYLACDGAAVSRTTYATLFTAISTLWGVGDGSTTFNVPNFSAGWAAVQSAGTVGASTAGEVIAHIHTVPIANSGPGASNASGYYTVASNTNTASTGGTHNLAGGNYVLKCIKT